MTESDQRPAPLLLSPLARITAVVAAVATVGTVVLVVYGAIAPYAS